MIQRCRRRQSRDGSGGGRNSIGGTNGCSSPRIAGDGADDGDARRAQGRIMPFAARQAPDILRPATLRRTR